MVEWRKDIEGMAVRVLIDLFVTSETKNHYVFDYKHDGETYTITVQKAGKDSVTEYITQLKTRIEELEDASC